MKILRILKQAQEAQSKLRAVQEDMEEREIEGTAGNGLARVTLTGKGALCKISLDESLLNAKDKEILEDLIVAAHRAAKKKADAALANAMEDATSGLNLPPGFKLPI